MDRQTPDQQSTGESLAREQALYIAGLLGKIHALEVIQHALVNEISRLAINGVKTMKGNDNMS